MPFYHVWFSTKYRKWLLQGDVAIKAKDLLIAVAVEKGINLVEVETMVDHVHILLVADNHPDLSWRMKLLKGRSAYELVRAFPEIKLDAWVNSFWQTSFNARLVPENQTEIVSRYIRTQGERLEQYVR